MDHLKACIDMAAKIGAKTVVGAVCGGGGSLSCLRMNGSPERFAATEPRIAGEYANAAVRIGVEA